MNLPNGWELILVLLVVVLVFGSKRLPDSARALGRSMRILKAETKGLRDDDSTTTTTAQAVEAPQPVPPTQPVAPVAPVPSAQPPVVAPAYDGQPQLDAQGRPVAAPVNGSQPVRPAPHPQA